MRRETPDAIQLGEEGVGHTGFLMELFKSLLAQPLDIPIILTAPYYPNPTDYGKQIN